MRGAALTLVLALALVAAGCVGAEGRQAQELLDEAEGAFAELETYELAGTIRVETSAGELSFELQAAVDQTAEAMLVVLGSGDVPGFSGIRVVGRPEGVWREQDGGWEALPTPTGEAGRQFDLLPYVKDVDVTEGLSVDGEPATRVVGVLDAESFRAGFMSALSGGVVEASFSDTRVVLYLSDASRLPLRMLLDQSMEVDGERLDLSMDLRLVGVNEPVEIPSPGV
jgi:hypothetical protein